MPGRFVVDQSGIIRSAEADPDYTVRPLARSAQGNKRLLTSATAFSRLGFAAVLPEHIPELHSARQKRPEPRGLLKPAQRSRKRLLLDGPKFKPSRTAQSSTNVTHISEEHPRV